MRLAEGSNKLCWGFVLLAGFSHSSSPLKPKVRSHKQTSKIINTNDCKIAETHSTPITWPAACSVTCPPAPRKAWERTCPTSCSSGVSFFWPQPKKVNWVYGGCPLGKGEIGNNMCSLQTKCSLGTAPKHPYLKSNFPDPAVRRRCDLIPSKVARHLSLTISPSNCHERFPFFDDFTVLWISAKSIGSGGPQIHEWNWNSNTN